jgi:hypothetical protein
MVGFRAAAETPCDNSSEPSRPPEPHDPTDDGLGHVEAKVNGLRAIREQKRTVALFVDQVLSGGSNIAPLALAGMVLSGGELSWFALSQTIILAAVALQRSYLEGAFASQRSTGQTYLPIRWTATVAAPLGLAAGLVAILVQGAPPGQDLVWVALLSIAGGAVVTAQDMLRYCAISRSMWRSLVWSDSIWFLIASAPIGTLAQSGGSVLTAWILGAAVSCVGFIPLLRSEDLGASRRETRHRQALTVGRWLLLDGSLAQVTLLAPLLFAKLYADTSILGVYRLLQSSLAPVNSAYNVISLGLLTRAHEQHGHTEEAVRHSMRRKIRLLSMAYGAGTLVYCASAFTILWFLVGRRLIEGDLYLAISGALTTIATAGAITAPHLVGLRMSDRPGLSLLPRIASLVTVFAALFWAISWSESQSAFAVPLAALLGTAATTAVWFVIFMAIGRRRQPVFSEASP